MICVHMPYNPFSVPNEFINFDIQTAVWSLNVVTCITIRVAVFLLHCTVFKNDKFRTQFVFNHALSTLSVHYWGLHMHDSALYWDCNIYFFYLQCKIVGRESRQTLHNEGSWVPSPQIFMPRSFLADRLHDTWRDTPEQIGSSTWLGLVITLWDGVDLLWVEAPRNHFMNSTTLQSHLWLEIKWHYFQLASVLFRFELPQVISATVYM